MHDLALERNRRLAWAKFFGARSETQQALLWAAELAEWLERCGEPHPMAAELIDQVRQRVSGRDCDIVARYVDYHSVRESRIANPEHGLLE